MKKSHKKILILQAIIIIALWLNTINNVMSNNIFYSIYLFIMLIGSYFLIGFEKEEQLNNFDIFRIIFVYSIVYLLLIYIAGFLIGFTRNPYNIDRLINNITVPLIIIILEELIRYNLVRKSHSKIFAIIFATSFIFLEIYLNIRFYPLTDPTEIFNFIGILVLPVISRNILLTYIAYQGYYKVNILYRIIFELNAFILPIYPNVGVYLEAIFNIIVPSLIYFGIDNLKTKRETKINKKEKLLMLPPIAILSVLIILISGKTNYYAMAVGSGSMEPVIKVADAVVVEKTFDLKMGDILVHKHGGKIVLHRIIKIEKVFDDYCYYTKGDANNSEDNYLICKEQILGKVIFKIPAIGWPSVILERTINKR